MQHGLAKLEPIALVGDGLVLGEEAQDDAQSLVHLFPLGGGVNPHHVSIAGQGPGPHAQHHSPVGHVVKLDHTVGHHEGVVVGQADDAGPQLDVARAFGGGGNEQFGRRDSLPAGAVVLADPGLVVTQVVQPLDQLHVPVHGQGRIFADSVEGPKEYAEFHAFGQVHCSHLNKG